MANQLPIIEVDYYNCIWNKKVLTPQPIQQTGADIVPGGSGVSAAYGVWPLNNVLAPPLTFLSTSGTPADVAAWNSTGITLDESVTIQNFIVEEMYIRGGFNNNSMSYGVRAYLDEEEPLQQHRLNALIYSGIFNSRTGINRTNEFPVGTNITKAANPEYGSIQKIHADENDIVVLQENKCSRALIDKNAIYNAEGGGSVTTQRQVLGEIIPYAGEYGISRNPESFAVYAFRKYFVDRNRNAVLRLSGNGITEISEYGMRDWFRDNLSSLNDDYTNYFEVNLDLGVGASSTASFNQSCISFGTPTDPINPTKQIGTLGKRILVAYSSAPDDFIDLNVICIGMRRNNNDAFLLMNRTLPQSQITGITKIRLVSDNRSRVYGGWDAYNKQYVLSIQENKASVYTQPSGAGTVPKPDTSYYTLGYDEQVKGWPSFYTYAPIAIGSSKNTFLTLNNRYWNTDSTVAILQGMYQHYDNTIPHCQFYGRDNNAKVSIIANSQPSLQKNFLTMEYEGDSGWQANIITSDKTGASTSRTTGGAWTGTWERSNDVAVNIKSYVEGAYDSAGNTGTSANPQNAPLLRAGFDRKDNKYVANIVNNSTAAEGEVRFGNVISGVKGYYLDVELTTDTTTDPGGFKELYSVGLNYSMSSR